MMSINRRILRLLAPGLVLAMLGACSALLVGEGSATSPAIGHKQRSNAQLADDDVSVAALRTAIASDSMLRSENLSLAVFAGVATLSGVVHSFEARERAVSIAGNTVGISRVNNQLQVNTRR